jgi:ABC-type glycerol-3-phosphate transport system substrate-binding protein
MYYNQDMLARKGIPLVPKTWPEFTGSVATLTVKSGDLTISNAGTALGTYKNISHAKDLIALLFLQSGNHFINTDAKGDLSLHFGFTADNRETAVGAKAMDFYLSFANPTNSLYTWNEGLPHDRDAFIQSNLAYYFGQASELPLIRAGNPNLNFSVALPPQFVRGGPLTTGTIYGLAIPKSAPNQLLSYTVAANLTGAPAEQSLVENAGADLSLVPSRRDVIAKKPSSDAYMSMLYDIALVIYPWTDPNPRATDPIFMKLVSNISSGLLPSDQALEQAAAQISVLSANI